MKTYKYRIYPTRNQQELLEKHFGCCRFVYNWGLYFSKEKYNGYNNLCKNLTILKQSNTWLCEPPIQSLQQSLRFLNVAFQKYFKQGKKYPKFKKKGNKQIIHYVKNIGIKDNKIQVPKMGYIKCKFHRPCIGNIRNMTITKTASGKYFVSICTDDNQRKPSGEGKVGIDMGLKEFAILSDGTIYHNPRWMKKSIKRLKRLQKGLSRKQKGSSNKNKFRIKLARQYEKVSNQRLDFQHKVSREVANKFGFVAMEKLNIKGMMKNHKLASSIGDAGWYQFKALLSYKTKVVEIGTFEPSSKRCFNCGNIKQNLTLQDRIYHCNVCGYVEDRDINAAKNILAIVNQTVG